MRRNLKRRNKQYWGHLSGVRGDLSGIWGDLSGIWGDLDACEISDADRERGVDIKDLVED